MTTPQRDCIVLAHSGGLDTSVAIGWTADLPSEIAARRDLRLADQRVAR